MFARNLGHNLFVDGSARKWDLSSTDIHLESDEIALEYLCRHNYDIDRAKFNIECKIGVGKGCSLNYLKLLF